MIRRGLLSALLSALLTGTCLLLAMPVLGVLGSWLATDAAALATLRHQAQTVLPGYAGQSLLLALGVGLGVVVLGAATAVAVTLFEFPGRRHFEWALLLPLAMPAYVLAYAWTDALQFASPLHQALRGLLGAGMRRRVLEVALPLARPAVAAGLALALMETLADYGVGSYFGLATFSTGIFKAWLAMNDRVAAAQLASVLLLVVGLLLLIERRAQRRLRFASSRNGLAAATTSTEARPVRLRGAARWLVWLLCALPVLLGFVLPVAWLAWMLWQEAMHSEFGLPLARFAGWAWASLRLAGLAALMATVLALMLGFALRQQRAPGLHAAARLLSLGYAVPGAVIAVGVLLPMGWLQAQFPQLTISAVVTGTAFGVLYAYVARFSAVALQSVEAGYARVPLAIDESARMLGGSAKRLFFKLHLPLLQRSAFAAALLVFVDVMKELPATLVLRPFGSDTLAVAAYNFARDERLAEAALPSLAIVAVGLIPVLLLSRAMRAPPNITP